MGIFKSLTVEIETEAAQFPEKEYKNGIFLAVHLPRRFADRSLPSQSYLIHYEDTIPKIRNLYFQKELRGHSPNFYSYVSVCDLYIPTIGLHILLQKNMWTDRGNI